MKRKKRKKYNNQKVSELIRREQEISMYGKLLSLRPSKIHESKKKYRRNQKHKKSDADEEI